MYRHTPSCLRGPLSRNRPWWKYPIPEPMASDAPRFRACPAPAIRADLVARVRREIAEGRYDTPDKWEVALDRFMAHIEQW